MLPGASRDPPLERALADFAALRRGQSLATADPLGLGGLLIDAARVAQLVEQEGLDDRGLLVALLAAAGAGVAHFARQGELRQPASQRLAFRELGLAIGLAALGPIGRALSAAAARVADPACARLASLVPDAGLGSEIKAFWRDAAHRRDRSWVEHGDINAVMLATSLAPEGVVVLAPVHCEGH